MADDEHNPINYDDPIWLQVISILFTVIGVIVLGGIGVMWMGIRWVGRRGR